MSPTTTRSVEVGAKLPEETIDITTTLIVSCALATRDFQRVHHDPDTARTQGLPDIITNIQTTMAFLARYVCSWGGFDTAVRRLDLRLERPNHPGDQLVLRGTVRTVRAIPDGGCCEIEIDLSATNPRGVHATARAVILSRTGSEGEA